MNGEHSTNIKEDKSVSIKHNELVLKAASMIRGYIYDFIGILQAVL